jgi:acetyl esterase/lipase
MTGEGGESWAAVRRERAERIRETGSDMSPASIEAMFGLYARAHEETGGTAPALTRDRQYGPDPRQRLDVHTAGPGATPLAPVLIYVHGGGFVSGNKHIPGTPYYDNIGVWAVRHGMVGVTMTYRLAPQHRWPAGAEDVSRAVAWVAGHISDYGGDPARVVVAGHSAGATHVASYLAGHAGVPASVTGAALLSGIYDLTVAERNDMHAAYFGIDPGTYGARSPLAGLATSGVPVLLAVAEFDPPSFHEQIDGALHAFMRHDGTLPPLAYALGHNHISEIAALGLDHEDEPLGVPLLRFIESVTGAVLPRPADEGLSAACPRH